MHASSHRVQRDPYDTTEGYCLDCWATVHIGLVPLDIPVAQGRRLTEKRTHCIKGHLLTANRAGRMVCLVCAREHGRAGSG